MGVVNELILREGDIIKEMSEKEISLGLYEIKVLEVPLWRLLRFDARSKKLKEKTGFVNRTTKIKIDFISLLINYIKSFFQLIDLIFRGKQYKNIVFAFPRLVKHNGVYFDKFTDPVIEQSNLNTDTIVVQRNLSGKQFTPRLKSSSHLILSDFLDYTSKAMGIVFIPLFFIRYKKCITFLEERASEYFKLGSKFKFKTAFKLGEFYFMTQFIKLLYSATKCENIILLNREIFFPQISMAKEKGISSFELQHGITHSETLLYSGKYQKEIDPDYFLVFGEKWIGNQFSMPLSKIYNIGWAYKSWISNKIEEERLKDSVLVVSSPEITEKILKTTIELSYLYKDFKFVIRLHPQEDLSQKQADQIANFNNISIDDKEVDSVVSILKHDYCIGDNSSVLYEALNYGRKVAKIMYNGFYSKGTIDDTLGGIYYLKNKEDFLFFVNGASVKTSKQQEGIFDVFNKDLFNNLITIKNV